MSGLYRVCIHLRVGDSLLLRSRPFRMCFACKRPFASSPTDSPDSLHFCDDSPNQFRAMFLYVGAMHLTTDASFCFWLVL